MASGYGTTFFKDWRQFSELRHAGFPWMFIGIKGDNTLFSFNFVGNYFLLEQPLPDCTQCSFLAHKCKFILFLATEIVFFGEVFGRYSHGQVSVTVLRLAAGLAFCIRI